jgi:hypothetical protein
VLVVVLGIAVLAIALFALREPNGHIAAAQSSNAGSNVAKHSPTSPSKTPSHTKTPSTSHSPSHTPASAHHAAHDVALIVLNNTSIHGLAKEAAQRFESGGWTVTSYDSYANDIASTCAYYDPAQSGAKAAAEALQTQYPTIKRVAPRFTPDDGAQPLPSGPVVVVLTGDYAAN